MRKSKWQVVSFIVIASLFFSSVAMAMEGAPKGPKGNQAQISVTADVYEDSGVKTPGRGHAQGNKGGHYRGLDRAILQVTSTHALEMLTELQAKGLSRENIIEELDEVSTLALTELDALTEEELEEALADLELFVDVYAELEELEGAITVQKEVARNKGRDLQAAKKLAQLQRKTGKQGVITFVNGEEPSFDVPPVIQHGRTMIPFRAIAHSLKADTIIWNSENASVTVIKGEVEVKLFIGSEIAYVNGKEVTLDVPPAIMQGRTLIPMRFIAEAFKAQVHWDSETGSVMIIEDDAVTEEEAAEEAEETEEKIEEAEEVEE
jgi:undecaprenyl pyrophosphate synthase